VQHQREPRDEPTYSLDRFHEALQHAQKNARSGKVLFIPNGSPAKLGASSGALIETIV
jgi:hypothetical protein